MKEVRGRITETKRYGYLRAWRVSGDFLVSEKVSVVDQDAKMKVRAIVMQVHKTTLLVKPDWMTVEVINDDHV